MDFLATMFLENPVWLAGFSFVCLGFCLFVRRQLEGAARSYCLPATLAAILLLFVMQSLITTQREQVWQALDAFIAAIEQSDATAAATQIDAQFDSENMDRDEIVRFIGDALTDVRIYDTQVARRDVVFANETAELTLGARATVSLHGDVGQFHAATWKIGWRRNSHAWRINSIRPIAIDTIPVRSLQELRGLSR